jgi:hypothetical protein
MTEPGASAPLRRTILFIMIAAPSAVILGGLVGALVLDRDGYARGVTVSAVVVGALVGLWIVATASRAIYLAIPARGMPMQETMARLLPINGLTFTEEPPEHRDKVRPERFRTGELVWPKDSVYRGTRHGRQVYIRIFAEGASLVRVVPLVSAPVLRAAGGRRLGVALAPLGALAVAGASLPESAQWEGCEVASGPAGIEVTRAGRGRGSRFWLYDLWLAERLAHALDQAGAA